MYPELAAFQAWLRRRAPETTTHIHYLSDLQLFFAWAQKEPRAISLREVDGFIAHCQALGHAPNTVNRRLAALRSFYEFWSVEAEDAPANPVLPKRHFMKTGQRLPRDVEDPVLDQLFAVITNKRDVAMFTLMLRCGLRVGEIRNLSLKDLYLNPTKASLPRLWLNGKGGNQRVVYLAPQPLDALQAWLKIRPAVEDQAVFLNRFGRRFTVTGIRLCLAGYCHTAQLWMTSHQFRHTFGRHLAENGVPIVAIKQLMGHARIRTTENYVRISDQQVQADYKAAMQSICERLPIAVDGGAR